MANAKRLGALAPFRSVPIRPKFLSRRCSPRMWIGGLPPRCQKGRGSKRTDAIRRKKKEKRKCLPQGENSKAEMLETAEAVQGGDLGTEAG